jgi:NAD(P)-dependent dehydrogenase (short-subunit alcohol dehydrogenase family)
VIGAGGALGAASAVALAARGFRCVLAGPTEASLERTAELLRSAGGEAEVVCADASDEADVRRIFAETTRVFSPCRALVHAAAIQGPTAPLTEISLEQWQEVMRVNLASVFLTCREALPQMVARRRGSIVLISSADALRGFPMTGPYAASKSALLGFARALSAEVSAEGVRVNVLSPGPIPEAAIYQEAVNGIAARLGVEAGDLVAEISGARRGYSAEEVARGTVFLATSDSGPMTGQSLVMDSIMTQG